MSSGVTSPHAGYDPRQLHDVPTEPDDRCGQRVDGDLQGQHNSAVGIEAHQQRTADRASPTARLGASTTRPAATSSPTSRRMALRVRPERSTELRARRERSVGVQRLHEQAAEVGPPDRLAALPSVPCHGICASRAQNVGDGVPTGR